MKSVKSDPSALPNTNYWKEEEGPSFYKEKKSSSKWFFTGEAFQGKKKVGLAVRGEKRERGFLNLYRPKRTGIKTKNMTKKN